MVVRVPIDPYDNQPIRLAVVDGQPTVYSIGQDGRDDGGKIDNARSPDSGDVLLRLPRPESSRVSNQQSVDNGPKYSGWIPEMTAGPLVARASRLPSFQGTRDACTPRSALLPIRAHELGFLDQVRRRRDRQSGRRRDRQSGRRRDRYSGRRRDRQSGRRRVGCRRADSQRRGDSQLTQRQLTQRQLTQPQLTERRRDRPGRGRQPGGRYGSR